MKKSLTILAILLTALVFVAPTSAFAATGAGVKPGSIFYFFDRAFERVGFFFTFTSEKRVHKTLEYADERLAEIESVSEDNNSDGVKTALANYERNMAVAAETINEVTDKGQVERLLTSIADSTSKNQEVLSAILIKVPEEAKEAIVQAIEASKKGQEEAEKQLIALKGEIEELKKEVEALKKEKETNADAPRADEVEKLKREVDALKQKQVIQKQSVPTPQVKQEPKQPELSVINTAPEKKPEVKTQTTTLPNGAVIELDTRGDAARTIKEAPTTSQSQNQVTPPQQPPSTSVSTPVPDLAPIFTTPTSTPTLVEPSVIVQAEPLPIKDNFNSYSAGTIVGQGGWENYTSSGTNFIISSSITFEGTGALYNNSIGDAVVTKLGKLTLDGTMTVYVRTENRSNWKSYGDGNVQVRVSKNKWSCCAPNMPFAAVSFKADGKVAYYDKPTDRYTDFDNYNDNEWTFLEIQWRSSDKSARYRVNQGQWTDWYPVANFANFAGFDNIGFDFVGGGGGVYFDSLQ